VTSVTCVNTENSPVEGDTTTVCTTTVVTTVTTPESTTTTTTVAENLTSSGDILSNSTFGGPSTQYSATDWTVETNPGAHSGTNAYNNGGSTVGGAVASGDQTVISQTVSSVKTATGMSEAELQHGFRSTLSARLWFWNNKTNSITLKQTITDNAGNTTTQTRVLTDTGCGG
ncbi:uncharacterized protein METZ01_LOCUS96783, partial [marine metagenome]